MFDNIFNGAPYLGASGTSPQSAAFGLDTSNGTLLISDGNGWVPDSGVAAKGNLQGATAAGQANLLTYNVPVTGLYLVVAYAVQATSTNGSLPEIDVAWTEADTGVATTAPVIAVTATTGQGKSSQGQYAIYAKAGTNIVVSSTGAITLTYNIRTRIQFAG